MVTASAGGVWRSRAAAINTTAAAAIAALTRGLRLIAETLCFRIAPKLMIEADLPVLTASLLFAVSTLIGKPA